MPAFGERCAAPWISLISIGGAGGSATVSAIVVEPERACASVAVTGSDFVPGVVPAGQSRR